MFLRTNHLKYTYINACSLGNKHKELGLCTQSGIYDVTGITKTWYNNSHACKITVDRYRLEEKGVNTHWEWQEHVHGLQRCSWKNKSSAWTEIGQRCKKNPKKKFLQKCKEPVNTEGKHGLAMQQERWISHQQCFKGTSSQHSLHLGLYQHCWASGLWNKNTGWCKHTHHQWRKRWCVKCYRSSVPPNWWALTLSTWECLRERADIIMGALSTALENCGDQGISQKAARRLMWPPSKRRS